MSVEEVAKSVLDKIDAEALVDLALKLGNIPSPKGYEREVGDFIYHWLLEAGFSAFKQEVLPGRYNVVATLPGTGQGRNLIFNSHMDTSRWRPEDRWVVGEELHHDNHAWVNEGNIYGSGVVNDKGPMAAFMIAAKAIKESGSKLKGDVILTMVVGETGMAPVDEFQGPKYLGKGIGAKHLVEHGVCGDYALVAETSNFGLTWAECGNAFFKIAVPGKSIYTPFMTHPEDLTQHPSTIMKMAKVMLAIEEYAKEYEQRNRYEFGAGTMVPKVSIGAIRGGHPYAPTSTPALCSIYVDVRITPKGNPHTVQEELKALLEKVGIKADIQLYMYKRGYEAKNFEPLQEAILKAHRYIFKEEPRPVAPVISSMWRDSNVFNAVGIPSISYGPGHGGVGSGREDTPHYRIADLQNAARVYALVALNLCG